MSAIVGFSLYSSGKFGPDRIVAHESICSKIASHEEKRGKFDIQQKRYKAIIKENEGLRNTKNTQQKFFQPKNKPKSVTSAVPRQTSVNRYSLKVMQPNGGFKLNSVSSAVPKPVPTSTRETKQWKADSEDFHEAVNLAKKVKTAKATRDKSAMKQLSKEYVKCPKCLKAFARVVARNHVKLCTASQPESRSNSQAQKKKDNSMAPSRSRRTSRTKAKLPELVAS